MKNLITYINKNNMRNRILNIKNKIGVLIILNLLFYLGYSQELPNLIPPSPNASALGKYGEIPVGLHTGTPNIDLEMWKIKLTDFQMPISVSYHASGHRVEESASWMGLGWTLNAGGIITRSVKGIPDESPYGTVGYLHEEIPSEFYQFGALNETHGVYIRESAQNLNDTEPDSFFFNFNGYTGKFTLDTNGVPHITSFQKLKIEIIWNSNTWIITDPNGTKYEFGGLHTEYNTSHVLSYNKSGTFIGTSEMFNGVVDHYFPTAWYLKRVISPLGNIIDLDYESEIYHTESSLSERIVLGASGIEIPEGYSSSRISSRVEGKRLSEINFPNGSIEFKATNIREDLYQNDLVDPAKSLNEIIIKDGQGRQIKRHVLSHSYFISDGASLNQDSTKDYLYKRLKLDSIQEYSFRKFCSGQE